MRCTLVVDCDNCLEDKRIVINFKGSKDTLSRRDIREKLKAKGWHDGMNCLCPKCKEKNLSGE